jgi:hypothetical protein
MTMELVKGNLTLIEILREHPGAARVFHRNCIDIVFLGTLTLSEACSLLHLSTLSLMHEIWCADDPSTVGRPGSVSARRVS